MLIVLTLAAVSWGQDKLLQAYGARDGSDDRVLAAALSAVAMEWAGKVGSLRHGPGECGTRGPGTPGAEIQPRRTRH